MRRVVVRVLLAALLLWLASLGAVVYSSRHDAARPADAIVVLGAAQYNGRPSPVLKARLDHAAQLYRRHLAARVFVTGGTGPGDSISEAEVSRRYLVQAGVPNSALFKETQSRSSEESLRAVAAALAPAQRKVILVSDGFHMLRLVILARRLGLTPLGSPARGSPIHDNLSEALRFLAESVKAPAAFFVTRSE